MTVHKSLWIKGAGGSPSYSASDMRRMNAALLGGRAFETLTPGVGALGRGHGILSSDALKVTAQTTPNNTVNVAPGIAAVRGTAHVDQGSYLCPLSSPQTVTIPARDPSSQTNHYVVAQVEDAEYAGTVNAWKLAVISGTPGAGYPSVPANTLVLAGIIVAAGTTPTAVSSSHITDLRPHARTTGGITPVATTSAFPTPKDYEVVFDISTNTLKMYLSGAWVTIGANFSYNWTSYTPTFGGVSSYGSGGFRWGRYVRFGRTIIGHASFRLGTGGDVTGQLSCTLPVTAANPGDGARYSVVGEAQIGGIYACTGIIKPTVDATRMVDFATAGNIWNASNPGNWTKDAWMLILFDYEAAS